ncbi:MAG: SDR family oxidoreductase [Thermoflexales bacterium]|nr:SDR family oxidoreductase [Thermoflexales bacterium]
MRNKIVVVTGGTNGIGLETARALAKAGADVHIVGRSQERIDAAVTAIKASSGSEIVHGWKADLASQASIRELAPRLGGALPRIDVLINNAGALFMKRELSTEGIEMTWALNHLNYFTLTHLLLDAVKSAPAGRIVNVSSAAHLSGKIRFDDPEFHTGFAGFTAYSQSKLANVMFTNALARRLAGTGVTANSLHPGGVATGFARNNGGLANAFMGSIWKLFALSAEKGAATSVFLASSPEVAGLTGGYYSRSKLAPTAQEARDETAQERLWAMTAKQTGIVWP